MPLRRYCLGPRGSCRFEGELELFPEAGAVGERKFPLQFRNLCNEYVVHTPLPVPRVSTMAPH